MTDDQSRRGPTTRRPVRGARKVAPGWVKPVVGFVAVLAVLGVLVLAVGLFRASFTKTVPLTVVSPRAGLVMNPDGKVKMRGVQVGKVDSIENRPDGTAVLHLAMYPDEMRLIPSNVTANIASSTVFGAKFVELEAPAKPSQDSLQPGQVLDSQNVTVEINTVFQQLVNLLDKIDPSKMNETLGAISKAFNGRGEKIGQTLSDFNQLLAKIDPSLPNLEHEMQALPTVANAYADSAANLMTAADNATHISRTLVDEQKNLDSVLISVIGLADLGNEVLGGNRQALTDVLRLLVPTTELLDRYNDHLRCAIGGIAPFARTPPLPDPGVLVSASFVMGIERYRYPMDLPKVNARSGNLCESQKLPKIPPEWFPPYVVADVGANPWQYGNQGILLNSAGLKEWLFGQTDGPPRNSQQIGMPG